MSDEEVVDFKGELEKQAHPQCEKKWEEYQACKKRLEKKGEEGANCSGTFGEYWQCIDKAVAKKLFKRLK